MMIRKWLQKNPVGYIGFNIQGGKWNLGLVWRKKDGAEAGQFSEGLVDLETLQTGSIDPLNLDGEKMVSLFSLTFNGNVGCPSAMNVGEKHSVACSQDCGIRRDHRPFMSHFPCCSSLIEYGFYSSLLSNHDGS